MKERLINIGRHSDRRRNLVKTFPSHTEQHCNGFESRRLKFARPSEVVLRWNFRQNSWAVFCGDPTRLHDFLCERKASQQIVLDKNNRIVFYFYPPVMYADRLAVWHYSQRTICGNTYYAFSISGQGGIPSKPIKGEFIVWSVNYPSLPVKCHVSKFGQNLCWISYR